MPARHISSQSFDDILSDLGDDPAIPDPHGIRKPPHQQSTPTRPSNQSKSPPFIAPAHNLQLPFSIQKFASLLGLIGVLIAAAIAFFIAYNALSAQSQSALEQSQKLVTELKNEMALIRDEIHQDQNDINDVLDEIEVSIHLLKEKKAENKIFIKPQMPSHEAELRRWRYLGTTQMGDSQQAYFHMGKGHIAFEKGAQVLGEWRLSNIEKELATFTHSQGKSLVLKASKSE